MRCLTSSETASPKIGSMDLKKKRKMGGGGGEGGEGSIWRKCDHKEIGLVDAVNSIVSNCFVTFLKTTATQTFGKCF